MTSSRIHVHIDKGIHPSVGNGLLPDSCGLDLWASSSAIEWITATLGATPFTIRVRQDTKSSQLLLWARPLVPGIVLASGYPYSTIIGDVALFWGALDQSRAELRKWGVSRMELTLSGDHINRCFTPEAEQQLNSRRVRCGRATRQVIDFTVFSKIDSLERSLPASVRWSIRKAAHEGIAVLSVGADSVEAAQALYVQTMREKGAPAYYGAERFRLLFRNSRSADIGCLYLAYQGQMAVGMAAVADSYTTRHLLQLAVPQRFRKSRVADLLIATALREAYVSGKRYFDFMATSRDDAGLTEFKAKWGGTTEDILHVVIPVNPLRSKLVDGLRQTSRILAASRLWRLMPRRICS